MLIIDLACNALHHRLVTPTCKNTAGGFHCPSYRDSYLYRL